MAGLITCVGVGMQTGSNHSLAVMYGGRLVAGLGVGAASMLTPLYGAMSLDSPSASEARDNPLLTLHG